MACRISVNRPLLQISAHDVIRLYDGDLWRQKNRVPGLSCGVVCVILHLAILVEHRLVTDGRTDRHRAMASTADA